jgi:hypothetical protein
MSIGKNVVTWQLLLKPLPAFALVSRLIVTFGFVVTSMRKAFEVYSGRLTTGLTYEQLGLRPKILVLTYDLSS